MTNEFKKITNTSETRYVLETATSGATSAGAVATVPGSLGKVQKRGNILAQEADKKKEAPKPRNFVAKNAKMGGAGQHKDKKKAEKQGNVKHKKPFAEQGVAEGFNGEYDDEAGMAQSNLLTTARAVMGLLKTIKDRDNLPEWGQEKIAKAEMMLVSVWDYLQSQKEQGIDPQQDANEAYGRYDRRDAYQRDYDSSVSGMDRGNNHRDDERHDLDPSDWYIVKDGKMYKTTVYPNQEQQAMDKGFSRSREEAKSKADGVAEGAEQMTPNWAKYVLDQIYNSNGAVTLTDLFDEGIPGLHDMFMDTARKHGLNTDDEFEDVQHELTVELEDLIKGGHGVDEGERTMSRAAKGNEKYGKDGMKALAKAGREGASDEKLDTIRDKHDNYNEDSDPCWASHKMVGTKKKGGKTVPNCVPKESVDSYFESLRAKVEELAKK